MEPMFYFQIYTNIYFLSIIFNIVSQRKTQTYIKKVHQILFNINPATKECDNMKHALFVENKP